MRWIDRQIRPMHMPVGPDGVTYDPRLVVQTIRVANELDLVTDPVWQAAPLTKFGRGEIPCRFRRGWRIRMSHREEPLALVVNITSPAWLGLISRSPEHVNLMRTDRMIVVTSGFPCTGMGPSKNFAFGLVGDAICGTRPLTAQERRKPLVPAEDLDALGALIP